MTNPFEVPRAISSDDALLRAKKLAHDKDTIDKTKYLDVRDRGVEEYESDLGFSASELSGKLVLNLGAGERMSFEKELKDMGIEADIVSLSLDYADDKHRKKILKRQGTLTKIKQRMFREESKQNFIVPEAMPVAALAQQLPFADGTFGMVLCDHVMEHLRTPEAKLEALKEIARVLQVGSRAYVSPFHDSFDMKISDKIEEILPRGVTFSLSETRGHVSLYDERGMKFRFPLFRVILEKER